MPDGFKQTGKYLGLFGNPAKLDPDVAQRGQPLLLDAVGFIMGLFMNIKIDLLKCIRVAYC